MRFGGEGGEMGETDRGGRGHGVFCEQASAGGTAKSVELAALAAKASTAVPTAAAVVASLQASITASA